MAAAWSAQTVSVAIAMGAANRLCLTEHGIRPSNPAASGALDTATLVSTQPSAPPEVFVISSSTRLLPHALPTRLAQHSFLETMRTFARDEINFGTIRQRAAASRRAARRVHVHRRQHRGHERLGFVGVAGAHALRPAAASNGARFVGRRHGGVDGVSLSGLRARRDHAARAHGRDGPSCGGGRPGAGAAAAAAAARREEEDEGEEEGAAVEYEDEQPPSAAVALSAAADAMAMVARDVAKRKSSDTQTLSPKRKRPPSAGVIQPMGGGFLDYWQAALQSGYASILKMMITQFSSRRRRRRGHADGASARRRARAAQCAARGHFQPQRDQVGRGDFELGRDHRGARAQDSGLALSRRQQRGAAARRRHPQPE